MMPDSELSRIARLEQRADDFEAQLNRVLPLGETMAEMRANMVHLEHLAKSTHNNLARFEAKIEKRDELRDRQVSAERRGTRNALYLLAGTLGAAIIGAVALVIAAAIGG